MLECPYCHKFYSSKGIQTHIMRSHLKTGFEGSHGRNNSYKNKEYKDKVSSGIKSNIEKRNGTLKEFNVVCQKCEIEFWVIEPEKKFPKKDKYFCSRSCSNTRTHTEESRNKLSAKLLGVTYNKNYKRKSECILELTCFECGSIFYKNKENKFCSKRCSSKFSNRNRYKNLDKSSLSYYRKQCGFKFNLKDYPDEFDFSLIEQFGWYKAKNRGDNLNGVSRDHIISVKFGFDNNIDPKIISHPANCNLLRHSENVSKGKKCDLSIEGLLNKIEIWNHKYYGATNGLADGLAVR